MSRIHSPRLMEPEKVEMFIINKCEGGGRTGNYQPVNMLVSERMG